MFRYLAFVWDPAIADTGARASSLARRLQHASPAWRTALEQRGLHVLYADARRNANQAYRLHAQGVVLGKLFHRDEAGASGISSHLVLDHTAATQILNTGGKLLAERYWGRYVAFLYDAHSASTRVVRDPTGKLPCFHTWHDGIRIFFSWTEDCLALGLPAFSINWPYVEAHLAIGAIENEETGLNEVSRLLAGECLHVRGDVLTRSDYWHPKTVVAARVIEDRDAAASTLRQVTRSTVRTWASCYSGILHRLSGGLDSSIVASCLRDIPGVTCINYFSQGSDSDERCFARLAAKSASLTLIERERDARFSFERIRRVARTAVPSYYVGELEYGRTEASTADAVGATAYFTGIGGDQLYGRGRAIMAVSDFMRAHGVGPTLWRLALDAARLERRSIWQILRVTLRDAIRHHPWDPRADVGNCRDLVSREIIAAARASRRFLHPWVKEPGGVSPGKLWHISSLTLPVDYYDPLGLDGDPERVNPLLSQPIIEACLQVPLYLHASGATDRGLAREAFAHDLPSQLITRRSKGGQNEHYTQLLLRNRAFMQEMLDGGVLVSRGLLDRGKLAHVLAGRPTTLETASLELFSYLSLEAWLQSWAEVRRRAVA